MKLEKKTKRGEVSWSQSRPEAQKLKKSLTDPEGCIIKDNSLILHGKKRRRLNLKKKTARRTIGGRATKKSASKRKRNKLGKGCSIPILGR